MKNETWMQQTTCPIPYEQSVLETNALMSEIDSDDVLFYVSCPVCGEDAMTKFIDWTCGNGCCP